MPALVPVALVPTRLARCILRFTWLIRGSLGAKVLVSHTGVADTWPCRRPVELRHPVISAVARSLHHGELSFRVTCSRILGRVTRFVYRYAWDAAKAATNVRKHGVQFELAATVLDDPLALSRYDGPHSTDEERWVTLGRAGNGALLVVVHTFEEVDPNEARVRIISSRPATRRERRQYEDN